MIKIAPSILTADFANLKNELLSISEADLIHLDVMDGNFVPNLTFGPKLIKDLREYTKQIFDVHLMVNNPENYVKSMSNAGANIFTFHYESVIHANKLINDIKMENMKAGISIVPSTNENVLKYLIDDLDLILVMTVNPGFGGQKFLTEQLKKIENIKNMIIKSNKNIILEVDGGINEKTIIDIAKAGADVAVVGSYIFNENKDYNKKIKFLKDSCNNIKIEEKFDTNHFNSKIKFKSNMEVKKNNIKNQLHKELKEKVTRENIKFKISNEIKRKKEIDIENDRKKMVDFSSAKLDIGKLNKNIFNKIFS